MNSSKTFEAVTLLPNQKNSQASRRKYRKLRIRKMKIYELVSFKVNGFAVDYIFLFFSQTVLRLYQKCIVNDIRLNL